MYKFAAPALVLSTIGCLWIPARADEITFAYEADVWPWLGGFPLYNPCSGPGSDCTDWLQDGHYVTQLTSGTGGAGIYGYHRWITMPGGTPPPTLWVEWRFRSNYSIAQSNGWWIDDGRFTTVYNQVVASVTTYLWGDAALDAGEANLVTGMSMGEFHTFRFEVRDGQSSLRWADGELLMATPPCCVGDGTTYIQFGGDGGSFLGGPNGMGYPGMTDEWDFVRYGAITYGEVVVASSPPNGYIDPREDRPSNVNMPEGLTRFTVTFDQPNGLNVSNITVESTAPPALRPVVQWVTRPDGDFGTSWEIRLDKRIPPGHRTRFIISDEADAAAVGQVGASSTVEYGFLPGDVNADSVANTQDLLAFISAVNAGTADVLHEDITRDNVINTQDLLRLVHLLNGTNTSQPWNGVSLPNWP
jgi:hypothetical protein